MVAKKSSKASLDSKKSVFTLMGFIVGLSLLFIALEWSKTEVKKYDVFDNNKLISEDVDIIQTIEKRKLPPPPPPPPIKTLDNIEVVENNSNTESVDFSSETNENEKIDIYIPVKKAQDEEEDVEFVVVEEMPSFPGNIFKFLAENIHYPQEAIDYNIQGKVYCEFVVNKDGSIGDIKVIRGVDRSLDKEAVRVIQSMPKWNPGLQRGKAVKVRYTLPITFKLMF